MEGLAMMNRTFWKGKKVFVTGHTGFKGSWLTLWLKRMGSDIIGYSLSPPTDPNLFEIANVSEGINSIYGDIRDLHGLKRTLKSLNPEIVIHMAAQSIVRESYANPIETYSTNILGTANVLEAVRYTNSVRAVLIVTTDKCYENREWVWGYRESDALGGHDPYSSSKACAEIVTAAYRRSYFSSDMVSRNLPSIATARAGNVIGGGDWSKDRLIPDIMNSILANRSPFIRYPDAIRPWQFVLEPLHGYLTLLEALWNHGETFTGAWNFGPNEDDAQPVAWITDHLTHEWGEAMSWESDTLPQPHEASFLKLDCSKARSLLGISPVVDLTISLKWIVEWYRAYSQEMDMRQVTEEQIIRYENMIPS
jgi:CDP-glucose 4,6-dehydratase